MRVQTLFRLGNIQVEQLLRVPECSQYERRRQSVRATMTEGQDVGLMGTIFYIKGRAK